MKKLKIFSNAWFDMVEQTNKQTELHLSPRIKDICLNIVITDKQVLNNDSEQEELEDTELSLHSGYLSQGLHEDAKTQVQFSYKMMKSLLENMTMDSAMRAFIQGDILVTGDMSQLMALQMAKASDEQKLLFKTILEKTEVE